MTGASFEFDAGQTGGPPNGVFALSRGTATTTLAAIRDGTSSTAAFGEWRLGAGNINQVTVPGDTVFVAAFPSGVTRNTAGMSVPRLPAAVSSRWIDQCVSLAGNSANRHARTPAVGENWSIGLNNYTLGGFLQAPNPKNPHCVTAASGIDVPGLWTLGSHHPGGANVVMCDGSVRFLKDGTSQPVVWSLGTRAQGEIVSADSY